MFHELASTRERQPSGVGKVADPGIMSGESGPEGLPGRPDTEREESVRRRSSTGWRGRYAPPARPRDPSASRGEGEGKIRLKYIFEEPFMAIARFSHSLYKVSLFFFFILFSSHFSFDTLFFRQFQFC